MSGLNELLQIELGRQARLVGFREGVAIVLFAAQSRDLLAKLVNGRRRVLPECHCGYATGCRNYA